MNTFKEEKMKARFKDPLKYRQRKTRLQKLKSESEPD